MKKTLQQYLDEAFPNKQEKEDLRILNINEKAEANIRSELKKIEGGELDLSEFSNLEEISIDGKYLKTPLTTLTLGKQENLKKLVCVNNSLTTLDLSQCSELKELEKEAIYESELFAILTGWENTKLVPAEYQDDVREFQAKQRERILNQVQYQQIENTNNCKIL